MKAVRTEMPTVDKGIPCPFKNHPKTYHRKQSMWNSYLAKLEPGDSFLIEEREVQNLTHIARQRQLLLVIRRGPDEQKQIPADRVRVWLAPEPEPESKPEKLVQMPGPKAERTPGPFDAQEDLSLL